MRLNAKLYLAAAHLPTSLSQISFLPLLEISHEGFYGTALLLMELSDSWMARGSMVYAIVLIKFYIDHNFFRSEFSVASLTQYSCDIFAARLTLTRFK
jgi:hypothetical protein